MVAAIGDEVYTQQVLVGHHLVAGTVGAPRLEGIQQVQFLVHRALRIDEVDNTVGASPGSRVPFGSESPPLDLVLDTNVVLDWLAFGHPVGATLAAALTSGRCRWICTRAMRDELADVIAREALKRWAIDAPAVLAVFDALGVDVGSPTLLLAAAESPRCSDPDDQMFIDLAIARSAHALLTRDRALLRLASRARRWSVWIATPEAWAASDQH
jgi:predicted nucleic acid-binding protein